MDCVQLSLFGKTYPEHSVPTEEKISEPCWKNLPAWNNQTFQFLDLRGGGRWSKAGAIAGNGWSLAWRQLDAQYWGVPQRRKRIALVVDFAGGRAGEILFERESVPGHPDPCIPTWESITRLAQNCTCGNDRMTGKRAFCISGNTVDRETNQNGTGVRENGSFTVNTVDRHAVAYSIIQPVVFDARGNGDGRTCPTITGDHENRIIDYTAIAIEQEDCLTPWDNQARRIYSEN